MSSKAMITHEECIITQIIRKVFFAELDYTQQLNFEPYSDEPLWSLPVFTLSLCNIHFSIVPFVPNQVDQLQNQFKTLTFICLLPLRE
jgi:hypothetical protein